MRTQATLSAPQKENVHDEIVGLMGELPYDSLVMLREFGRFLRFQEQRQPLTVQVPIRTNATQANIFYGRQAPYPVVRVPPAQLLRLIGALPPLGGDALADTEAIYEKD